MSALFLLICGLIMLPMIFSVPLIYRPALAAGDRERGTVLMLAGLLVAILAWLAGGYQLIFGSGLIQAGGITLATASDLLVQLDFFLYAVVMFSGSAVPGRSLRFFLLLVPLWLLLVYGPVAWLMWTPTGWLNQLGARDFSGGLVVHLTAGLTSLILTWGGRPHLAGDNDEGDPENPSRLVALFLILTGWMGFNLAPLGGLKHLAGLVVVNTLLAVVMAAAGWSLARPHNQALNLDDLINGVICGLVTSTALVGYVATPAIGVVALASGVISHRVTTTCQRSGRLNDPVDSFGINATGGLVGTLGLILFANPAVNPAGGTGLLSGHWQFTFAETLAILVTAAITLGGGWLAIRLASWLTGPLTFPRIRKEEVND